MNKKIWVLNVAKWRCGDFGENGLGEGNAMMLNQEGYMCCLGQFSKSMGVEDEALQGVVFPNEVAIRLANRYSKHLVDADKDNTELSRVLMMINDDCSTTVNEKIDLIRSKLKKHNIILRVTNRDKVIK